MAYTPPTISGYNQDPPPDDGSTTDANLITWAKHKSKLADPIKTYVDDINTEVAATFDETVALAGAQTITGAKTFNATLTAAQQFILSGVANVAQITSDQNNYNPTELATSSHLNINSDAIRTITGLAGGSNGRMLTLLNNGNFNIVLAHQNTSSTAANRFSLPSATDITLKATEIAVFRYDGTLSRWVCVGSTAPTRTADTTYPGAVEKATQAETNAGTADKYPSAAEIHGMVFKSAEFAATAGADHQFTHTLGVKPRDIKVFMICKTSEGGWPVGAKLPAMDIFASTTRGAWGYILDDTTNAGIQIGNGTMNAPTRGSGGAFNITPGNWSVFALVYA